MNYPKVGAGVIVQKDNKILLGERIHALAPNAWCFPSGHVEFLEAAQDAAIRETFEETGLTVSNLKFLTYTDDIFSRCETAFCFDCFYYQYVYG